MSNLMKFKALQECEMKQIKGGDRDVVKIDIDGDGRWDVKIVRTRGRTKVIYR